MCSRSCGTTPASADSWKAPSRFPRWKATFENALPGTPPPTPAITGPPLLNQPTRRRLLDLIQGKPGIKISHLCRESGAGWGTVKYHLQLLEKAGLVVARAKGRDCLLFPRELALDKVQVTEAMGQGRAGTLARAIADSPGANQKELCEQINMTRKIIRRYVGLLADADLVTERREAQFQRYYPNPRLMEHLRTLATKDDADPATV